MHETLESDSPVVRESRLGVLRNRNFTALWAGVIVSNAGSWMQIVAQGYLVYQLSGSPFLLGLVGMARAIPMIVLPPFGGVVADRVERLKLLKFTQAGNFLVAFVQGAIVSLHVVTIWELALIGFLAGAVNAFDQPSRQALLPDLVPRQQLSKAIALNSSAWQGSALFGPTLAGITIAAVGVAGAFYANAVSFLAVLIALFFMKDVPKRTAVAAKRAVAGDLIAGLKFAQSVSLIWVLLVMATVTSIFGRSFQQLLPVFAVDVFTRGGLGLGVLYAAPGAGTIAGAVAMAVLKDPRAKGRGFLAGTFLFGVTIMLFALNRSFPVGLVLLFCSGVASIVFSSLMTTMIQLEAPDDMRGRIMSLVTVTMQGFTPIGALLTGAIASRIGTPEAVAASAVVLATAAIATFLGSAQVRNYGVQQASLQEEPITQVT
jgi:MFS family permease